jgi:hypothetical protein
MEKGGFQNQPLMRLTLALTLGLLLAFWLTNFGVYFSRMSLRPESVVAYYNGSAEDFRPPRSLESMLETTHMHLPMMGLVLLFLTHLAIFVPLPPPAKTALIVTTFVSAVLEEGGGWLVRYVSPGLAPLKVIGFVGLQSAILFLLGTLSVFLFRAARPERSPTTARKRRARTEASAAAEAPLRADVTPEPGPPGS